jgi:predicted flap endonuclease-1-like 5' DNA nuclease
MSNTQLPIVLPAPARRALEGAGYTRVEQLSDRSQDEIKKLHGIGPKAIRVIRDALEAVGMSLAEK